MFSTAVRILVWLVALVSALTVSCIDPLGSELVQAAGDTAAPSIQISTPRDGSFYGRTVRVTGTVRDLDGDNNAGRIDRLTYQVAGTDLEGDAQVAADGSFAIQFQTDGITGDLETTLSAADWNDNLIEESIVLRDDEEGPWISVSSPEDGTHFTATVTVSGTIASATEAEDFTEVRSASWQLLGSSFSGTILEEETRPEFDGGFEFSFETTGLSGPQTVEIIATDWNGYVTRETVTLVDAESTIPSLTVEPQNGGVVLDWDPLDGVEAYTIYYTDDGSLPSPSYGTEVSATAPPVTISGLENGRNHVFLLEATMNSGPENYSSFVGAIPLSKLSLAPLVREFRDSIELRWPGIGADVQYRVLRATDRSGPYTNVSGNLTKNSFVDSQVSLGTTYFYKVQPAQAQAIASAPIEAATVDVAPPGSRLRSFYSISQTEGNAIEILDDTVYVGGSWSNSGPRGIDLSIYEVSSSGGAVNLGSFDDPNDVVANSQVESVAIQQGVGGNVYAYLAKQSEGVLSLDVSNPAFPTLVERVTLPGADPVADNVRATFVEVVQDYVVAAYWNYGVVVYSADDGGLTETARFQPADPADFRPGGVAARSTASGELHLFVTEPYAGTAGERGLYVATIGQTALNSPAVEDVSETLIGTVGTTTINGFQQAFTLALNGETLFLALDNTPTTILSMNVSNPTSPTELGKVPVTYFGSSAFMNPEGMYYADGYLTVLSNAISPTGFVRRIDVSDPTAMQEAVAFDTNTDSRGIVVRENLGYIADEQYGLRVVDLSLPPKPIVTASDTDASAKLSSVLLSRSYVFATDLGVGTPMVRVYEASAAFDQVSQIGASSSLGAGGPMVLAGDTLFVGGIDADIAVHAFDVSSPSAPIELDTIDLPDAFGGSATVGAGSLARVGPYLYVTDGASSLLVIDASDPSDLRLHETLPANDGSELVLDFPTLYVTESGVYDVSDPGTPDLLLNTGSPPGSDYSGNEGVAVGDNLFMLGRTFSALVKILDNGDLTNQAGEIPPSEDSDTDPLHVSYLPGYLVLGVEDTSDTDESGLPLSGLRIYSVEDPVNPLLVQIDSTRDTVYDFDAQGAYAAAVGGSPNPTELLIYRLE